MSSERFRDEMVDVHFFFDWSIVPPSELPEVVEAMLQAAADCRSDPHGEFVLWLPWG